MSHVRPMGLERRKIVAKDEAKVVESILKEFERESNQDDYLYRQGQRLGFVYGLVCGALGIAVLAVVVLGDVIGG